jgi:uncharacterized protein with HEPN domain
MAATRNPRVRLLHIRDEIDEVTRAIQGASFDPYKASYLLWRTAERAVQIISEAAKSLPTDYLARYPEAPWNAIVGIGNILRHEYQEVDDRTLWDVVSVHLPLLRPIVIRMLTDLP